MVDDYTLAPLKAGMSRFNKFLVHKPKFPDMSDEQKCDLHSLKIVSKIVLRGKVTSVQ